MQLLHDSQPAEQRSALPTAPAKSSDSHSSSPHSAGEGFSSFRPSDQSLSGGPVQPAEAELTPFRPSDQSWFINSLQPTGVELPTFRPSDQSLLSTSLQPAEAEVTAISPSDQSSLSSGPLQPARSELTLAEPSSGPDEIVWSTSSSLDDSGKTREGRRRSPIFHIVSEELDVTRQVCLRTF